MLPVKEDYGENFCSYPLQSIQILSFFLFLFLLRSLEAEIKNTYMANASATLLSGKTCNLPGAEPGVCGDCPPPVKEKVGT